MGVYITRTLGLCLTMIFKRRHDLGDISRKPTYVAQIFNISEFPKTTLLTKKVAISTTSGSAKELQKSDARRNDYFSAENSHYKYAAQTALNGACLLL